jgi:glutamate synthase domain-containing protein 3
VGLNEALVHNGDFANYASIAEYLAQRNIYPLYLTDTEVSVLVFDLLHRTYAYPLEYVIEALAPTTERDFTLLPQDKKHIYPIIQKTHMHCSPDGPWFFLIAQSAPHGSMSDVHRLIGITDTSMLRPQVFALQQSTSGGPAIGFAASEKQAIDAALESLSGEDPRFWSRADKYWNARGGSHTDGGAFIFSVNPNVGDENGSDVNKSKAQLVCTDKFGRLVEVDTSQPNYIPNLNPTRKNKADFPALPSRELFKWFCDKIPTWSYNQLIAHLNELTHSDPSRALEVLTLLMDQRYNSGNLRRSSLLTIYDQHLEKWEKCIHKNQSGSFYHLGIDTPQPTPTNLDQTAVINARGYPPEGESSLARSIVKLYERGFKKFIILNARGHRFIGNGLGANSKGVQIDVYGSSGDYLASGLDGAEIHVHGSGQDQLAQIMKSGKLAVHGDVGQTFGYAAKGGEMYILGNAAGRPMINAVGKPRVIINGTCLDYLAESFMAGDPHNGGGFVILNGIAVQDNGEIIDLDTPYPGGNLFSLASGGAIYVRDPNAVISEEQLNGGQFMPFEDRDWNLLKPYLQENERYFNIPINRLLGDSSPREVYRKIRPRTVRALQAEEAWVHEQD